MIVFKTLQSATFMKTEYKGFEITISFERDISGKNEVHYSIDEIGNKLNLVFGRIDWNGETAEKILNQLKTRVDREMGSRYPNGIKFPVIAGAWVPISERLPPEAHPVYTLSRSGAVGVYARFGARFSSLISTDNEEICYWHESEFVGSGDSINDNPAEACAAAWLAIHEKEI